MTDFGRDLSCTDSIHTGRFVTGTRLVAEAAYRRLTTPRGLLRGGEAEQDYGLDLSDLIGSVETTSDLAALQGRVRNELLKDERILTADTVATATTVGPAVAFDLAITGTTKDGPFTLQLAVSEVTVELLGITP